MADGHRSVAGAGGQQVEAQAAVLLVPGDDGQTQVGQFAPQTKLGSPCDLCSIFGKKLSRGSDVIGDDYAYFMRCNPDHHGIALLPGKGTFHHHAWQTQSVADLAKLGDRLNKAGRDLIWGPVRHGAGHNIAAYYVEHSGAVVELYTDLEQIYDDNREPIVWGAEDNWWNMWSDYRPLDFRDFGIPPVVRRLTAV